LIPIEERHFAFWQGVFDLRLTKLDPARRAKLAAIVALRRLLGASAIHLVLDAIEVYGVRKYLKVWSADSHSPLGSAVRAVREEGSSTRTPS
jgi:vacuolar iron transporter family protein